jgi:membrane associated rhomboid family serine protease
VLLNGLPVSSDEATATIGPVSTTREVREWSLVLASMEIGHAVRERYPGYVILLAAGDEARAREAIRLYEAENRNWPPPRVRERLPYARSLAAPFVMALFVLFYAVTGPASDTSRWFTQGTAVSELILHGQLWRAVTALTLHADTLHIVGNALSGTIFLSALNRRLGDGRGPFVFVLGGALGNLMNALWYHAGHMSIGASTAVFAAVGTLAATQVSLDRSKIPRPWLQRAAPIVGGVALLGMLGASPHTDLLAHLFGLVAGLLLGAVLHFTGAMSRGRSLVAQLAFAATTVALLAGSWWLALIGPAL